MEKERDKKPRRKRHKQGEEKETQKGVNKENIAVVPFDKGQGFVTIERDKLVEKSEKEFNKVNRPKSRALS